MIDKVDVTPQEIDQVLVIAKSYNKYYHCKE